MTDRASNQVTGLKLRTLVSEFVSSVSTFDLTDGLRQTVVEANPQRWSLWFINEVGIPGDVQLFFRDMTDLSGLGVTIDGLQFKFKDDPVLTTSAWEAVDVLFATTTFTVIEQVIRP